VEDRGNPGWTTSMNAGTLYRKAEDKDTWARITAASCHGALSINGHGS